MRGDFKDEAREYEDFDRAAQRKAEGERMEWPKELWVALDAHGVDNICWGDEEPLPGARRYVPEDASHFTQLVQGLEAEIRSLREAALTAIEPESYRLAGDAADRLQLLLDQHKKEGRSNAS